MKKEDVLEWLDDVNLDIDQVNEIYNEFMDEDEVVSLVAMNISRRTKVDEPDLSYSQTMVDLLTKLSCHSDMGVRWAVAKSPHTKPEVLKILAKDDINLVRALVATNKNTPIECLNPFFNDEKIVRDGLSGNPNVNKEILNELAKDDDKMVRMRVASNPSTSKDILQSLTNDKEEDVSIVAKKALEGTLWEKNSIVKSKSMKH